MGGSRRADRAGRRPESLTRRSGRRPRALLNRELPGDWGTARIVERGERLADLAVRVWPRPATDQPESTWLPEGPDGEETPLRRGGGPRGDIAAHIVEIFAGLPAGNFMTISQISKCSSAAHPDGLPSQGAISARLGMGDRPRSRGYYPTLNGVCAARADCDEQPVLLRLAARKTDGLGWAPRRAELSRR